MFLTQWPVHVCNDFSTNDTEVQSNYVLLLNTVLHKAIKVEHHYFINWTYVHCRCPFHSSGTSSSRRLSRKWTLESNWCKICSTVAWWRDRNSGTNDSTRSTWKMQKHKTMETISCYAESRLRQRVKFAEHSALLLNWMTDYWFVWLVQMHKLDAFECYNCEWQRGKDMQVSSCGLCSGTILNLPRCTPKNHGKSQFR
jgi:hypothetical protein